MFLELMLKPPAWGATLLRWEEGAWMFSDLKAFVLVRFVGLNHQCSTLSLRLILYKMEIKTLGLSS